MGLLPAGFDLARSGDSQGGLRAGTALSFLNMDAVPHTAQRAAAFSPSPFIDEDTVAQEAGHLPKLPCG